MHFYLRDFSWSFKFFDLFYFLNRLSLQPTSHCIYKTKPHYSNPFYQVHISLIDFSESIVDLFDHYYFNSFHILLKNLCWLSPYALCLVWTWLSIYPHMCCVTAIIRFYVFHTLHLLYRSCLLLLFFGSK